jgi:phosphatidylglycerol---prolipoprotein diacylglyceryl transferase
MKACRMMLVLAYYVHDLSPFLFELGNGFGVRYYGLSYALAFVALYFGLHEQIKRGWCLLPKKKVDDYVFWVAFLGAVVGGRLGYVLLYDFQRTIQEPLSVFQIWKGGMASHGGILGVIGVMWSYGRKHGIPFYNLADATALCAPIGLFLGRCANFINGELWGRISDVPWAVRFPKSYLVPDFLEVGTTEWRTYVETYVAPRHPSQLYEAVAEGLLLLLLLWVIRVRATRDGAVALSFMGLYALGRIFCEFYREPDSQIGYYFGFISQGQLLSVGLMMVAVVLAIWRYRQTRLTGDG